MQHDRDTNSSPAATPVMDRSVARLGQGFVWQDLYVGQRLRTFRRTITESDLVQFIGVTGMLEAIFIEEGYEGAAMPGRPVPGALTYTCLLYTSPSPRDS